MDFMLRTTNLCKNFKEQTAVDHVSLHIPRNSVYGLLGPNGAGKSTILKMITGILRPTSGEILFDGHPWSRKDLTHIGALIETPPLYENLSAYENLKAKTLALGQPYPGSIGGGAAYQYREKKGKELFSRHETAPWYCACVAGTAETFDSG